MDPNWIMAIIALAAIVSPVLSTYLSNKQQLKLKQLETIESSKYNVIEKFSKSLEDYYFHRTTNRQIEFESSIANLHIYFDIPDYSLFDKIKECINLNDYSKTQYALAEIIKYLSKQINNK